MHNANVKPRQNLVILHCLAALQHLTTPGVAVASSRAMPLRSALGMVCGCDRSIERGRGGAGRGERDKWHPAAHPPPASDQPHARHFAEDHPVPLAIRGGIVSSAA